MKYIVLDEVNSDIFTSEFATKEEALKKAVEEWEIMSKYDKKRRSAFYVLESINPDEDSENHLDGNVIKDFMIEEV